MEVNIYIGIWTLEMKCTQYGICGEVAFKNARAIFFLKVGRGGLKFSSGSRKSRFLCGTVAPARIRILSSIVNNANHRVSSRCYRRVHMGWKVFGCYSVCFCMFCNFYQLHNETCVALASIWWGINKNRVENWTAPYVLMVIGNVSLLILELNT